MKHRQNTPRWARGASSESGSVVVGMAVLCFALVGLLSLISTHATAVDALLNDRFISRAFTAQTVKSELIELKAIAPDGRSVFDRSLLASDLKSAFNRIRAGMSQNGEPTETICGWGVRVMDTGSGAYLDESVTEPTTYCENQFLSNSCEDQALNAHKVMNPTAPSSAIYVCISDHATLGKSELVPNRLVRIPTIES